MTDGRGGVLVRIGRAWRALTPEGRLASFAALGLFLTMFLPWYQQNAVVTSDRVRPLQSQDLSAFGVFSFVEAAVLLVALAVLALLFARAERRTFHLPGGDGTVLMAAGLWAVLLLVWRLFDKPGITTNGVAANVGIQWGIFFALAAAGLLAYAGSRMRQGRRPPAPLVAERRRPRDPAPPGTTRTRVLPPEQTLHESPTVAEPATQRLADGEPTVVDATVETARTRENAPGAGPRRRGRPPASEDQLTMPLGSEPPLSDDERP